MQPRQVARSSAIVHSSRGAVSDTANHGAMSVDCADPRRDGFSAQSVDPPGVSTVAQQPYHYSLYSTTAVPLFSHNSRTTIHYQYRAHNTKEPSKDSSPEGKGSGPRESPGGHGARAVSADWSINGRDVRGSGP
ncbi:hypothetical protein ACOMHN_019572 [Nucella lapillus]